MHLNGKNCLNVASKKLADGQNIDYSEKRKRPKGFICPCTGVKYHNIQTCLLVYAADSGERLQDHWSSGFLMQPLNVIQSIRSQALEVIAINHKNNASNKCLHGITKYCQVCKPRFRSHYVAFPARFLESEQMLHGNLKRSIENQNGFNQLLPDTYFSVQTKEVMDNPLNVQFINVLKNICPVVLFLLTVWFSCRHSACGDVVNFV